MRARLNLSSCASCLHYFHLCPANGEKCSVSGGWIKKKKFKCRLVTINWICARQRSIRKTCDEFHTAGNEKRVEKKGVGVEVGVNNSYCRSFEETANDLRGEMESAGLFTVSNITALIGRLPIISSFLVVWFGLVCLYIVIGGCCPWTVYQDAHSDRFFLCLWRSSFSFHAPILARVKNANTAYEVVSLSVSKLFVCDSRWGVKEHQSMTI